MSQITEAAFIPCYLLSETTHQFARKNCNDGITGLNYIWLTPVNIAANLTAMVITPLVAAVNLVVAGLFAAIGVCSCDEQAKEAWYKAASESAKTAILSTTILELAMFIRLFNVNACKHLFDN